MMKPNVFISFPMNGLSKTEIVDKMHSIQYKLERFFGDNVNYIDSILDGENLEPLWCLGESIKLLSEADIAVFDHNWEKARGCRIEHACAVEYNIPILVL